jgi:hypothetical protein
MHAEGYYIRLHIWIYMWNNICGLFIYNNYKSNHILLQKIVWLSGFAQWLPSTWLEFELRWKHFGDELITKQLFWEFLQPNGMEDFSCTVLLFVLDMFWSSVSELWHFAGACNKKLPKRKRMTVPDSIKAIAFSGAVLISGSICAVLQISSSSNLLFSTISFMRLAFIFFSLSTSAPA